VLLDLVRVLNDQFEYLKALGRHKEALAAIRVKTDVYRKLTWSGSDVDRFLWVMDLIDALVDQSEYLKALGRHREARAAHEEAVRADRPF
jgi:hypothetical protein